MTPAQRAELVGRHRLERERRRADRVKAILMLDSGLSYDEIAEYLLLDDSTVRRFYQTFVLYGVDELMSDDYKGGVARLTSTEEKALKLHLTEVVYPTTKAICAYVEEEFDAEFTIGGMRHLLRRLGFRYIKPKTVPGKADAEKQAAFIDEYGKIKENLGENDKIYFADACHPVHQAVADYGWMPRGKPRQLKTNSERGRVNLNGAVELTELDVVMRQEKTVDSAAVIRLLKQLENRHPSASAIYFICDNARYYTSKEVKDFTAGSRVKMLYLPAYSPNLNPTERLWKYFRRRVMANIYRPTCAEFQRDCAEFFRTIRHRKDELRSLLTDNFERFEPSQT